MLGAAVFFDSFAGGASDVFFFFFFFFFFFNIFYCKTHTSYITLHYGNKNYLQS